MQFLPSGPTSGTTPGFPSHPAAGGRASPLMGEMKEPEESPTGGEGKEGGKKYGKVS